MKRKFFYIIMVVCCLSLLSSARQIGKGAEYKISKDACTSKITTPCERAAQDRATGYEFSPMGMFLLSI